MILYRVYHGIHLKLLVNLFAPGARANTVIKEIFYATFVMSVDSHAVISARYVVREQHAVILCSDICETYTACLQTFQPPAPLRYLLIHDCDCTQLYCCNENEYAILIELNFTYAKKIFKRIFYLFLFYFFPFH